MSVFRAYINRIERASKLEEASDLRRQIETDKSMGKAERIVLNDKLSAQIAKIGRGVGS